jgi:hypothetical protein
VRLILGIGLALAIPMAGFARPVIALSVGDKLNYQIGQSIGPLALLGDAAYAGILQGLDTPTEWGQGGSGYGKRLGSTMACSGIHSALAFGLDSTLHEDPRYFRSGGGGFWRRTGHTFRGTILTHTDKELRPCPSGASAALTGLPICPTSCIRAASTRRASDSPRVSSQFGFDLARNLASEFGPDLKRKMRRQKP